MSFSFISPAFGEACQAVRRSRKGFFVVPFDKNKSEQVIWRSERVGVSSLARLRWIIHGMENLETWPLLCVEQDSTAKGGKQPLWLTLSM